MSIQIPGPAGPLEAMLTHAPANNNSYAVLCHPHPQFGGTMHDAVLDIAQRALLATGTHCLRFNFRGVGASAGVHDTGKGEADDVSAAVGWVREEHAPTQMILAGYSFGAAMAWQALDRIEEPDQVILIAPPVGLMALPQRSPQCPVDVVAGDADQYLDAAALAAWQGITPHIIEGANHFFTGYWEELEDRLQGTLRAA